MTTMCECCTPKNTEARQAENDLPTAAEPSGCGCGCGGSCGCGEPGNTNAEDRERKSDHTGRPVAGLDTLSI